MEPFMLWSLVKSGRSQPRIGSRKPNHDGNNAALKYNVAWRSFYLMPKHQNDSCMHGNVIAVFHTILSQNSDPADPFCVRNFAQNQCIQGAIPPLLFKSTKFDLYQVKGCGLHAIPRPEIYSMRIGPSRRVSSEEGHGFKLWSLVKCSIMVHVPLCTDWP